LAGAVYSAALAACEQNLLVLDRIGQQHQPMDFSDAGDAAAKAGRQIFQRRAGDCASARTIARAAE
jgi:hypothetical protein